jgi:hypothetical protein
VTVLLDDSAVKKKEHRSLNYLKRSGVLGPWQAVSEMSGPPRG